jgi:lactate permease
VYSLMLLLVATLHGPWLVDIFSSSFTIIALLVLLRYWKPKRSLSPTLQVVEPQTQTSVNRQDGFLKQAILPWAILSIFIVVWGLPKWSQWLDSFSSIHIVVTGLHQAVLRMPPAVPAPTAESAIFNFNWLSATGTGIFIAAIVAGFAMGTRPAVIVKTCAETFVSMRFTFVTIAALMALGFVTRYAGMDATLGLAFARTGHLSIRSSERSSDGSERPPQVPIPHRTCCSAAFRS